VRLKGKTTIVTGGSRGIGAAIAERFATEGAEVVIASRKQEVLDATAAEINQAIGADRVHPRACHTGDPEQIAELVEQTSRELGVPTVLVNNAATNPYFGPMLDVEWAAWDKTFDVNVKGYFEMTRQVVRKLQEADSGGSIVNVSSINGVKAAPLQGVYSMTKAAVISMTQTLAQELGHAGIRVNAVCPGLVETKFASIMVNTPEISERYTDRAPLGRWAQPEEITGLVTYLASDDASYVTGQHWVIDGGYLIGE
jgi:NAD(P)-dependent dehydrogenase (short-subunit alcohol dehydrogenase family)